MPRTSEQKHSPSGSFSILDFFSIGIGPSSSHTVGPMRAAAGFAKALEGKPVARIHCKLHGSLAATGKGHGSDGALILGFCGELPETVDVDAMTKQLIDDSLATLLTFDMQAQNTFEKFIARRLAADASGIPTSGGNKLLAHALAGASPQARLMTAYVRDLTGGSLQSVESLYEVVGALGVDPITVGIDNAQLKPIFDTRNKIIHELDINLSARRRNRNLRSQRGMIGDTNTLLALAKNVLVAVDQKLSAENDKTG